MEICGYSVESRSTSNNFVKAICAATIASLSILLAGCDTAVRDIESPTPVATENRHLVELAPRMSVHNLQPMFMVEALGFTAVDETGWDWAGSDEIYAIWRSNALVATEIFGNVDSGNSRDFHELQSCIYPIAGNELVLDGRFGGEGSGWICKDEGGPGPIKFSVAFYDDDEFWISIPYCFNSQLVGNCKDSFVGEYTGTWSNEELADGWPAPGSVQDFTVRLDPCEGPTICGDDNLPDYDFRFRITRMADKEILPVVASD